MTRIKFKHKADSRLFTKGQPMYSLDNGKTWNMGEWVASPDVSVDRDGEVTIHPLIGVITKVDHQRGSITVKST